MLESRCIHRACDTTENIDREVLDQNTRALVRALRAVGDRCADARCARS
jgi:hypothetical protein